jgi:hypothetical protein
VSALACLDGKGMRSPAKSLGGVNFETGKAFRPKMGKPEEKTGNFMGASQLIYPKNHFKVAR